MNVQQLSDLYEIQRLKARYFRYVDTKQWDKYRDLFTEEVDFGHQKGDVQNRHLSHLSHRSFDDLMSYLRTADSGKVTAHHGHMPEIEFIDDDTATGIWAMFDWVDDSTRGVAWQGYGHYHERYVRCARRPVADQCHALALPAHRLHGAKQVWRRSSQHGGEMMSIGTCLRCLSRQCSIGACAGT